MIEFVVMAVIMTLANVYIVRKYFEYKSSENRKDRELKLKQSKMRYNYQITDKKLDKTSNIDKNLISEVLENIESPEDVEDIVEQFGLPSWITPLAQGFLEKVIPAKKENKEDSIVYED